MEICTCRNCLSVFGTAQTECPLCGADEEGEGAEVELDGEARSAIARLGGLYASILPGPGASHLLWCTRGVGRFDEAVGLAWAVQAPGPVEDVSLAGDRVRMVCAGRSIELALADGEEHE